MSARIDRDHSGWKEYRQLLGSLSKWFLRITALGALVAGIVYLITAKSVEQISHRSISPIFSFVLMTLPILIQGGVFYRLHQRFQKTAHDRTLRMYFTFYFSRMAFSLFSYTFLWFLYVAIFNWFSNSPFIQYVQFLPLMLIAVLVGLVIHATYLVTKSSFHSDDLLLNEHDIAGKYPDICRRIKTSTLPEIGRIREWLRKDRDCKIHRAALKGEVEDLDPTHLTEALNRLVTNPTFYRQVTSPDQKVSDTQNPFPREIETANRQYIDTYLLETMPSDNGESNNSGKSPKKQRVEQERLVRQRGQRDGIGQFPFYTMVFFFSVFLCVAYVFGFAFAFADRHLRSTSNGSSGALFMSDDQLEDANLNHAPTSVSAPINYQLSDLHKVFYFRSGGAGIAVKRIENAGAYAAQSSLPPATTNGAARGQGVAYIAEINQNSLRSIVTKIKEGLEASKLMKVELAGRADDNALNTKGTYSSNYEVAVMRIKTVRHALQEQLIELRVSPAKLASLEWVELPLSNDTSLSSKRKAFNPDDSVDNVDTSKRVDEGQPLEASNAFWVLADSEETVARLDLKERKDLLETINSRQKDRHAEALRSEIRTLWDRLAACINQGNLTRQRGQVVIDDIDDWETKFNKGQNAETSELRNQIEQELYQLEEPEGSRRAVEVSLFEAAAPTVSSIPHSKRMALLDYHYFAMSTITTTGYGDIRPMTPYAKFLCTLASITEVFFIVVFFNTLLSLKRGKTDYS